MRPNETVIICEGENCAGNGGNSNRSENQDPCATELQNFIRCVEQQSDITKCDGYNTLLKECRRFNGTPGTSVFSL